jgi:hypothetical protein
MKKSVLVILTAVAILVAAGVASLRLAESASSSAKASTSRAVAPCASSAVAQYGHIESLTRKGDHFELRFDPAWFLSGVTASRAKLEDTGSGDVPNDNYVVEEGHRLLTYLVPSSAHVTVLVRGAALDGKGFPSQAITVSQLAQLVKGEQPIELYESLESGFWMHVNGDAACSLEQQYRP